MGAFVTAKLGDLSTRMTVGTSPTVAGFQFVERGVNFIPASAITADGFLDTRRFAAISRTAYEAMSRAQITADDVLVCLIKTGILRATIAASHDLPAATAPTVAIVRVQRDDILPKFLAYTLNGRAFSLAANQKEKAKTQHSLTEIRDIQINVLPLRLQQHLCEQMESYETQVRNCQQRLRTIHDELLRNFDQLISALPPSTLIQSPGRCADREELPTGWRWVPFGELVDAVRDMIGGEEARLANAIWLDDIEDYSATVVLRHRVASGATNMRFNAGNIIVGPKDKRIFKVAMAPEAGLAPQDFMILRPRNDHFGAFALLLMRSSTFAAFRTQHAAAASSWNVLKKWQIAIPPKKEMERFGTKATAQLCLSSEIAQSHRRLLGERRAVFAKFV